MTSACPFKPEDYKFDTEAWKEVVKRAKEILADPSSVTALPEGADGYIISPPKNTPEFKAFQQWARIERFALEAALMWKLGRTIENKTDELAEKIVGATLKEVKDPNLYRFLEDWYAKLCGTIKLESRAALGPLITSEIEDLRKSEFSGGIERTDQLQRWRRKFVIQASADETPEEPNSLATEQITAGLDTNLWFDGDVMQYLFTDPRLEDLGITPMKMFQRSRPLASQVAGIGLANLTLTSHGTRFADLLNQEVEISRRGLALREPIEAIATRRLSGKEPLAKTYAKTVERETPRMRCPAFFYGPDDQQGRSMFDVVRNITIGVYGHSKVHQLLELTTQPDLTATSEPTAIAPPLERGYRRTNPANLRTRLDQ